MDSNLIPTIMPASTSTTHGSSISQHLHAIKRILQDVTSNVEYVWNC